MALVKKVELGNDGLATSSGVMTVYNYDSENGLYIGATVERLTEGVGIPANSTSIAPPSERSAKVRVYSESGWQQVDDHRGELVYNIADGKTVEVRLPGDYPDGTTPLRPATPFDFWNGKSWQTDTEAQRVAAVSDVETVKSACISEANSITQAWQTQLLLGMITDDDKAKLIAWMEYIQAVQAIDPALAPDTRWPEKPV